MNYNSLCHGKFPCLLSFDPFSCSCLKIILKLLLFRESPRNLEQQSPQQTDCERNAENRAKPPIKTMYKNPIKHVKRRYKKKQKTNETY
jgi:hypothetical protein